MYVFLVTYFHVRDVLTIFVHVFFFTSGQIILSDWPTLLTSGAWIQLWWAVWTVTSTWHKYTQIMSALSIHSIKLLPTTLLSDCSLEHPLQTVIQLLHWLLFVLWKQKIVWLAINMSTVWYNHDWKQRSICRMPSLNLSFMAPRVALCHIHYLGSLWPRACDCLALYKSLWYKN